MAKHVGLFIPLPRYLARQYPIDGRKGEDKSPPHLTFCYLGDFDDAKKDELVATLNRMMPAVPPLELKLDNVTTFQNDDDQTIVHNPVSGQNLHAAHYAVKNALARRGFQPDDKFSEYKPHVTIEYVDPGNEPRYGKLQPTGRWRADAVELWGLGDPVRLPLGRQKASAKRSTIACLLRVDRPDLANQVAYGAGEQYTALLDEMRQLSQQAIDFVKRSGVKDIGISADLNGGNITLYTAGYYSSSKKTKEAMLELKRNLAGHLAGKTKRNVLHALQNGKKLWARWAGSDKLAPLDAYFCGLRFKLTSEEQDVLMRPKLLGQKPVRLRYEADKTPRPESPKSRYSYFLGDTYRHRDVLKRYGAKWDRGLKGWALDNTKVETVLQELRRSGIDYSEDFDSGYNATFYRIEPKRSEVVSISGKTYKSKDLLKRAGARWDREGNVWVIEETKVDGLLQKLDAAKIRYQRGPDGIRLT